MKNVLVLCFAVFFVLYGKETPKDTVKTIKPKGKVIDYIVRSGKIIAFSGNTTPTMIGADTVSKLILDTLKNNPVDSAGKFKVIWRTSPNSSYYYIVNIYGSKLTYKGKYDTSHAGNFEIAGILKNGLRKANVTWGLKTGKLDGSYSVALNAGDTLDPGYGTAALHIGPAWKYAAGDSSRYPPNLLAYGLATEFNFNDTLTKWDTIVDAIGNTKAKLYSCSISTGGKFGNCVMFNNGDRSVRVLSTPEIDSNTTLSILMWIKQTNIDVSQNWWAKVSGSSMITGAQSFTDGLLYSYKYGPSVANYAIFDYSTGFAANTYEHTAWVFNGNASTNETRWNIYTRAVKRTQSFLGTINNRISDYAATDTLYIGSRTGSVDLTGCIDLFQVCTTALAKEVIAAAYIAQKETLHVYDTTTTGICYVDTAAAQVDTVWFAVGDTTAWRKIKVIAGNVYSLADSLDANSLNTIFFRASNNVGPGAVTEYKVYYSVPASAAPATRNGIYNKPINIKNSYKQKIYNKDVFNSGGHPVR